MFPARLYLRLGWSDVAKVSCILRHRGVKLILAYSLARLAILVAVEGECFYFFCFFTFILLSPLYPSLSSPLLSLLSLFSLKFSGR